MNQQKTGALIRMLRKKMNLTQSQLGEKLHVSDKAVSKWETGAGCPEVGILEALATLFHVDIGALLEGDLNENDGKGGNMKNTKFYVCPLCGNIITANSSAEVSCCGKKLRELKAKKAEEAEKLTVETIDSDYHITSTHEMTKENYISFVALLTSDKMLFAKTYPEWDLSVRLPVVGHGMLLWYSLSEGLLCQTL